MRDIAIGISVHACPEGLHATLASLRRNTTGSVELWLLPDGPDAAMCAALASLRDVRRRGTAVPLGTPACFNRLAAATDASLVVLLESGAQVGPGWLDHLLAAFDADPTHGLAGPSTNRSWNEQGVFPQAGGTQDEIAHTAAETLRRFGPSTRTLTPLHSLADFCYAVRREVIEAIGAADERYGLGPCWEMDYNIRAARAGFRGVWACAAYVHRAPFTSRRQREEAVRFEASKHRYQDKFCALRLRGVSTAYEPHCRGEECEHFAPAALIQVRLPLPSAPPPVVQSPAQASLPAAPLVSCIMPTGGRPDFVLQSVRYFQRQDYPQCELVILDDGPEDLAPRLPCDPRVRYFRVAPGMSIGAKRNRACDLARGTIIAQWDDDDWYAPNRLSVQAAPLLSGEADVCGLTAGVFFELDPWRFWSCTEGLHARLFAHDVHGGTLVYQRRIWEQGARYPNRSLAEDAAFLHEAVRRGARLSRLNGRRSFIYLRHGRNSWAFPCGGYLDPGGWERIAEPESLREDRGFYAAHSAAMMSATEPLSPLRSRAGPLASCIMPTADRRAFVPRAIRYFLAQDYPYKELIILDDGIDSVADLVPDDPRIRYLRQMQRRTVGAKRNQCIEAAQGEIIVHWDDDDWYAPHRIGYQVEALLNADADVCGVRTLLFYDPAARRAWRFVYPASQKFWLAGETLCYRRSFWTDHRFADVNVGEDARFVWSGPPQRMLALPDASFCVAMIHPRNISPKQTSGSYWQPCRAEEVRMLLQDAWADYHPQNATEAPAIIADRMTASRT